MNNKIFISGRVTGDPSYQYKFNAAEDTVTDPRFFDRHGVTAAQHGFFGFQPVNPSHLTLLGRPLVASRWSVCMAVCLWHLAGCSHVYALADWRQSRGARIENRTARLLGKHIIYQDKSTRP